MHRANESLLESANGSMATVATRFSQWLLSDWRPVGLATGIKGALNLPIQSRYHFCLQARTAFRHRDRCSYTTNEYSSTCPAALIPVV
jgi:hypothetical protein